MARDMEAATAPELIRQGLDGGTSGVLNTVSDSATFPTEEMGALASSAGGLDSAAGSSAQIVVEEGGDRDGSVPEDVEYPTEETAPAAAAGTTDAVLAEEAPSAAAEAVPEPEPEPATAAADTVSGAREKGGGWMSGLASSMGFGDGASADKSSAAAAAVAGEEAEAEEEDGDEESVEILEVAVEPSSSANGDGAAVAPAPAETTAAAAAETMAAAAAPVPAMSPGLADRRKESIAAEMKSFLEDSDEEAAEAAAATAPVTEDAEAAEAPGADERETDGGAGEVSEQEGGVATAAVAAEEGQGAEEAVALADDTSKASDTSLRVQGAVDGEASSSGDMKPPAIAERDTEFSAGHAKRVIESGVVLERKASITGVVPELKNKSQFSAEDAAATISSGAISERTRKLKEEQEALRQKHATERQDTDLPLISAEMSRQQSVKGRAQMHQQAIAAIEGGDRGTGKAGSGTGRLGTDWTQRRETLEKFVVKYDKPENASTAGTPSTGEGPARYCIYVHPPPGGRRRRRRRQNPQQQQQLQQPFHVERGLVDDGGGYGCIIRFIRPGRHCRVRRRCQRFSFWCGGRGDPWFGGELRVGGGGRGGFER
ncbi:unnamed protein product, partial [Ectocarpus sp. 12 AP-2014]